jgi:cytochrome P450
MLVTRDPKNVQAVFGTQHDDWDISPLRAQAFMPFLGEGIFTSVGAKWKHSRALVRPQFAKDQISNLAMIEEHVQTLLDCLKTRSDGWTSKLDLQPLFFYFSLDVATEFLYGQSVNCQAAMTGQIDSKGVDGKKFSENFNEAKHLVDKRGALQKFHFLIPMKKMNQVCSEIHAVVDRLIDERLATKKDVDEEKGKRFVLLDELAELTNDKLELRRETLHTLMAGRDPTGSLLGWVFYFLARNPAVFDKLRQSILSDFGMHGIDSINAARLRQCSYLQWVMNESIRIPAVVPMNERTALRDTVLPTGGGEDGTKPIFVLKGTQILIPAYAMQHRPDIWGDDTETFRPDRWEGRRPGWEWVPFGGGPRKFLGRK